MTAANIPLEPIHNNNNFYLDQYVIEYTSACWAIMQRIAKTPPYSRQNIKINYI